MISQVKSRLALSKQLLRFGSVGVTVMMVHWLTVLLLVSCGQHPLMANCFAFILAFQLSYWGHRRWTFEGTNISHKKALFRFLITALWGFILNQALFSIFLKYTSMPYQLALLAVLALVSGSTFIIAKFWAFRLNS